MTEQDKYEIISHIADAHRRAAQQIAASMEGIDMSSRPSTKSQNERQMRLLLLIASKIDGRP